MAIRKGTMVRQVVPVIIGEVKSFQVDQESGELQYLVEWPDANGEMQSKYFSAGEVVEVEDAPE